MKGGCDQVVNLHAVDDNPSAHRLIVPALNLVLGYKDAKSQLVFAVK